MADEHVRVIAQFNVKPDLDRHLALPSLHATLRELMPLGDGTIQTGFLRLLGGEK